jgi:hypothetical protein
MPSKPQEKQKKRKAPGFDDALQKIDSIAAPSLDLLTSPQKLDADSLKKGK